jgi:hypothetical protein
VHLRGTISKGSSPPSFPTTLGTLPLEYRPVHTNAIMHITGDGGSGETDILANGDIVIQSGYTNWVGYDGSYFSTT